MSVETARTFWQTLTLICAVWTVHATEWRTFLFLGLTAVGLASLSLVD